MALGARDVTKVNKGGKNCLFPVGVTLTGIRQFLALSLRALEILGGQKLSVSSWLEAHWNQTVFPPLVYKTSKKVLSPIISVICLYSGTTKSLYCVNLAFLLFAFLHFCIIHWCFFIILDILKFNKTEILFSL